MDKEFIQSKENRQVKFVPFPTRSGDSALCVLIDCDPCIQSYL